MSLPAHPLDRVLAQASGTVLVLHDASSHAALAQLTGDVRLHALSGPSGPAGPSGPSITPPTGRWAAVVLAVVDVAALRRTVSTLPRWGRTRTLTCWLVEADEALLLTPRPEWPEVVALSARRLPSGGSLTTVRFARPAPVSAVLGHLARGAARTSGSTPALVVGTTSPDAGAAPPADSGLLVLDDAADLGELVVPPDVLLAADPGVAVGRSAVTGRTPTVVSDRTLLCGPVDEGLLNPTGFRARTTADALVLADTGEGLALTGSDTTLRVDPRRGLTPRLRDVLRAHQGVVVDRGATAVTDRLPLARLVAGLAMSGVPLRVPAETEVALRGLLGPATARAVTGEVDLTSPLSREEHSLRTRRAALLEHSTLAWRGALARAAGLPDARFRSCSALLATRRPERLDFALSQVARQRGVDVQLVVAAHGFAPDHTAVQAATDLDTVVLDLPADLPFGEVLNAALAASSGDLVAKMDDDDWYSPDFLLDLVLARHYSGADVVGMPADYVFLEEQAATVRRRSESERFGSFVAGGTLLLERGFLVSLGGFRSVHRYVDAQLLAATSAAGGSVYRTHGLGYVLRRAASGHTWDVGSEYFLDESTLDRRWEGFVPSAAMEL